VLTFAKRLAGTPRGNRITSGPKAARIRRFIGRWGLAAVVVGRFLPGGRTATAATFALRPGPATGFVAAAAVGSLIWAGYLVGIGSGVAAIL
jgi:membrane-associated protein